MNWAAIGSAAIILAGASIGGPAWAIPTAPPPETIAGAPNPLLLSVRYHRHHWRYRHYRHFSYRHDHSRWASRSAPEQGAGAVRSGLWEFTARLQTAASEQSAPGTPLPQRSEPQSGGGIQTSYRGCISSERAVPAEFGPQCKLDSSDREGAAITWAMTCTNPQGAVRSDGAGKYAGDTMEATMISHLPGADGKTTDLTQRITGRYLGPCGQSGAASE